jgi:hypothetical protein
VQFFSSFSKVATLTKLNTVQIQALTSSQIKALKVSQVQSLGTNQIAALTTKQIQQLNVDGIKALSVTQISNLNTSQISAISMSATQLGALTASQLNAMSNANLPYVKVSLLKPLALAGMSQSKLSAMFAPAQINKMSLEQWNLLGATKRKILSDLMLSQTTSMAQTRIFYS